MPATEEAKTVSVSESSSEMIMNVFKKTIFCSVNEDAGAGTVRNGSTSFLVLLLTCILNQTS